ncbi:PQQ-binding-like beta-propeller repeat protein [Mucilaginibacter jinjuensis]|uniref:PQQ-binding-like beta-propeller repeat protein n=1 Tax=Mucilaginibacter jinjuensis TaxID=1176721 RepID=A0ABY7TE35_9SPHI|nr:PQQ-binding-like beta-propeller repeat protein [Mucilaginibacter jinjuensis]WCT13432.1 PQQ-binding-like beta-propeller repeat protein [Mucilaginibacter jinjuensis]
MKIVYFLLISITLSTFSCKKDGKKPDPDPVSAVSLPDSSLFVNTLDPTAGTTVIYVINAATGAYVNKYAYPADAGTTWSYPVAGNNLLYTLQNTKINAIDINTGKVVWTDAVNNVLTPILHQQTFFGVKKDNAAVYEVYALDATKQTSDFSWKYGLPGAPVQINYYNDGVYIATDATHLTMLDAKTGSVKWSIATASPISFNAINDGVFIAGNVIYNASTGKQTGTAGTVDIPLFYGPGTIVKSQLLYATPTVCYIKTSHYRPEVYAGYDFNQDFLSEVDIASGTEKQRSKFSDGYILVPNTNTITQRWNDKLIVSQYHMQPAKFDGSYISDRYGSIPADLSAEPFFFESEYSGRSSNYFIAGNIMYYFKVFLPATGINPFAPTTANQFLAINLLTGKKQWSNDKSFEGYKGWPMAGCVYTSGRGYSPFIQ